MIHPFFSLQKKPVFLLIFIGLVAGLIFPHGVSANTSPWWQIQSVDTMKYSRDMSREWEKSSTAQADIDDQVSKIAELGATHVAIATPYDEEFLPVLNKWVASARKHGLNVWFRGNWSGWEGWFDYSLISRQEHIEKTRQFILQNSLLFKEGDLFTACPECENGGPGDPRETGDVLGYRQFLIDEHLVMKEAFEEIGVQVDTRFNSMNGDVARLVMDADTTQKLGGVVAIDHYVATPQKLIDDIQSLARSSGGDVFLGEIGVPIPDIHGKMTEEEQAQWLDEFLQEALFQPHFLGLNYWTNIGGSTQIWRSNGDALQAAGTIQKYFSPEVISGKVRSLTGKPIQKVTITSLEKTVTTDSKGEFSLPFIHRDGNIILSAPGYEDLIADFSAIPQEKKTIFTLKSQQNLVVSVKSFWQKVYDFIFNL